MERVERIELSTKPWQGFVLPLNHTRIDGAANGNRTRVVSLEGSHSTIELPPRTLYIVVGVAGFEPAIFCSQSRRLRPD